MGIANQEAQGKEQNEVQRCIVEMHVMGSFLSVFQRVKWFCRGGRKAPEVAPAEPQKMRK